MSGNKKLPDSAPRPTPFWRAWDFWIVPVLWIAGLFAWGTFDESGITWIDPVIFSAVGLITVLIFVQGKLGYQALSLQLAIWLIIAYASNGGFVLAAFITFYTFPGLTLLALVSFVITDAEVTRTILKRAAMLGLLMTGAWLLAVLSNLMMGRHEMNFGADSWLIFAALGWMTVAMWAGVLRSHRGKDHFSKVGPPLFFFAATAGAWAILFAGYGVG